MQLEHERRFLVADPSVVEGHEWTRITQAYLWTGGGGALRVRLESEGSWGSERATLTFKGPRDVAGTRVEVEQDYDPEATRFLVAHADHVVTKRRHRVRCGGDTWEVDVFEGRHMGLVIAELEASRDRLEALDVPPWCGSEVTADRRFDNDRLAVDNHAPDAGHPTAADPAADHA
jgi:adenylate cyclase